MIKIGFSGPPCSGKTSTIHEVVVGLRELGVKVDCLTSVERTPLYDVKNMSDPLEHNISFVNHVLQESLHMRRKDIEVLLVDRTVLDIMVDFQVSCGKSSMIGFAMEEYGKCWIETYDKIYLLPPRKFKSDGQRLEDVEWRNNIIKFMDTINCEDYLNMVRLVDVKIVDIMNEILKVM
jgi:hypothetical protein